MYLYSVNGYIYRPCWSFFSSLPTPFYISLLTLDEEVKWCCCCSYCAVNGQGAREEISGSAHCLCVYRVCIAVKLNRSFFFFSTTGRIDRREGGMRKVLLHIIVRQELPFSTLLSPFMLTRNRTYGNYAYLNYRKRLKNLTDGNNYHFSR